MAHRFYVCINWGTKVKWVCKGLRCVCIAGSIRRKLPLVQFSTTHKAVYFARDTKWNFRRPRMHMTSKIHHRIQRISAKSWTYFLSRSQYIAYMCLIFNYKNCLRVQPSIISPQSEFRRVFVRGFWCSVLPLGWLTIMPQIRSVRLVSQIIDFTGCPICGAAQINWIQCPIPFYSMASVALKKTTVIYTALHFNISFSTLARMVGLLR